MLKLPEDMCSEVDRNHPTITTSFPLLESFCLQDADLRLRQGEDTGAIGDATGKRSEPTPSGDCGWYTMDDPFAREPSRETFGRHVYVLASV